MVDKIVQRICNGCSLPLTVLRGQEIAPSIVIPMDSQSEPSVHKRLEALERNCAYYDGGTFLWYLKALDVGLYDVPIELLKEKGWRPSTNGDFLTRGF